MKKAGLVVFLVLLLDQVVKFWVKTNMFLGQEYPIFGEWAIIHFTENNGMAFGLELGGEFGKLALSVFRIFAVLGIGYYVYTLHKSKEPQGLITCIALIFAGAAGNIIDSSIYGLIFSESGYQFHGPDGIATFLGEGYAPFLQGKVVDMLYFPLIESHYPAWVPMIGGDPLVFFRPVFNIADAAISIGVALIIINQKKFFPADNKDESADQQEAEIPSEPTIEEVKA